MPLIQQAATAHAAGPATFEPFSYYGPGGSEQQLPRTLLPEVGRQFVQGGNLSFGAMPQQPQSAPSPASPAASASAPTARPESAAPTFPVQTPSGPKDLSSLSVGDLFPNGQGLPQIPPGKPGPQLAEIYKDDADRLKNYSQEASENQKIYQDLAHLRDVLNQSLNTNKTAPFWTDLTNIAHGLGADFAIPKSYDPANAAEFSKASTDLVFAAVKKLAGQVKVAEIEGYKQANPNIVLPRETNYNIINDILSTGKWQDARARLATEFATTYPGVPLGVFDAKFNNAVPLPDITASNRATLERLGATFPGQQAPAAEAPIPPPPSRVLKDASGNLHRAIVVDGKWVDAVTKKPLP
jgi:hypothetical protein